MFFNHRHHIRRLLKAVLSHHIRTAKLVSMNFYFDIILNLFTGTTYLRKLYMIWLEHDGNIWLKFKIIIMNSFSWLGELKCNLQLRRTLFLINYKPTKKINYRHNPFLVHPHWWMCVGLFAYYHKVLIWWWWWWSNVGIYD